MELNSVKMDIPEGANFILGQAHFIKTVEDLYEIMVSSSAQVKFGLAFCEASGPCLLRLAGNESTLEAVAAKMLRRSRRDTALSFCFRKLIHLTA